MIHKLLYIKNCGRFVNCTLTPSDWDGVFGKVNTIYAENGSGKTTFTQVIKSLSGNNLDVGCVSRRKTLQAREDLSISLVADDKKLLRFNNGKWNRVVNNIEIYDTYYAESNIYIISLGNHDNPSDFYKLILSNDSEDIVRKLQRVIRVCQNSKNRVKSLSHDVKEYKGTAKENEYKLRLARAKLIRQNAVQERIDIEKQMDSMVEEYGGKYLQSVNDYLMLFNPDLRLIKLNKKGQQLVYHLQINGITVRDDSSSISLKHSLSEGDKSSLSLSFFLARLDLMQDLSDKVIVFDDPLSSFDTRRRSITASILSRIANRTSQFFLLSHDLNFVKDFCNKVPDSINLKIEWKDGSSRFVSNSIKLESMTGISKDLYILQQFIDNGASSDFERRDIVRCIRPALEGVFRIKYFSIIKDNEWLGDFLNHIRECDPQSPFNRLKGKIYETISDINEYSQKYHHSNPQYMEEPIYDTELRQYVSLTLNIIMYI